MQTQAGAQTDTRFMALARSLAWQGAGHTSPNPRVGAVVVRDGDVVATGWHRRAGEPHAEAVALATAGERARGATLYVSLEPCAHRGRTGPCVEVVLASGVARVVVAALDPDPRVSGRGVAGLRARGVRVDVGCNADSAILDNLAYYGDRLGTPSTVTLKVATSLDGYVTRAPNTRSDVTGEIARREAHTLRACHDAVVVGVGTVLVDAPVLDCRLYDAALETLPVPVVIDTHLRTPADNAWSRARRSFVVVCGEGAEVARTRQLESAGARVLRTATRDGRVDLARATAALHASGLSRLWVEPGPGLLAGFLTAGVWDAIWHYQSPEAFGTGLLLGTDPARSGRVIDTLAVGADTRRRLVNPDSWTRLCSELAARTAEHARA